MLLEKKGEEFDLIYWLKKISERKGLLTLSYERNLGHFDKEGNRDIQKWFIQRHISLANIA